MKQEAQPEAAEKEDSALDRSSVHEAKINEKDDKDMQESKDD